MSVLSNGDRHERERERERGREGGEEAGKETRKGSQHCHKRVKCYSNRTETLVFIPGILEASTEERTTKLVLPS